MTTELYKRYRPKKFKDIIGQDDEIRSLIDLGKRKVIPHALLFVGESGVGKTTIARILRTKLKCSDIDFIEMNSADFTGIDTIRSIRQHMNAAPLAGPCRVWLIDECFPKGTLVNTTDGPIDISKIQIGQKIETINGQSFVSNTFKNKVKLDRIIKIKFSNGDIVFSTKQHKFFTSNGWIKAENLNSNHCIFKHSCYPMNIERNNNYVNMQMVQDPIQEQEQKKKSGMLFKKLCWKIKTKKFRSWFNRRSNLQRMWNILYSKKERTKSILQPILCRKVQNKATRIQKEVIQQKSICKNKRITSNIFQNREGKEKHTNIIHSYEKEQSFSKTRNCGEGKGNQTEEGYLKCLVGITGREWSSDQTTSEIMESFTRWNQCRLGYGSSNTHQNPKKTQLWIPHKLQSRYRLFGTEDLNRSRWDWTQFEKEYIQRCEEDKKVKRIRVESIEVYQQGNNDKLFSSVISNSDRNRGYVEFYDLEVKGHPSYFIEGKAVHNCHMMSSAGQEAFLKILEDTPKHVYFMLATTLPQKLKKTILTRCTQIKLKLLSKEDLFDLIEKVYDSEAGKWNRSTEEHTLTRDMEPLDPKVINKIAEVAEGSARKALVILHAVIGLEKAEDQLSAIEDSNVASQAKEIARALMKPTTKWPDMQKILNNIEEEPETIRLMVLGYCRLVLLGNGNHKRAAMIIEEFRENWFHSKINGLIISCYNVISS